MSTLRVSPGALALVQANEGDFEALLSLRLAAMREGLERLGRFDPGRARQRLGRSFSPSKTRHIMLLGQRVGFMAVLRDAEPWQLEHLYVDPAQQRLGIGGWALEQMLAEADAARHAVAVTALKHSEALRFYARYGFVPVGQSEWDMHYLRPAQPPRPRAEGPRP